jgi:hypothetical protein
MQGSRIVWQLASQPILLILLAVTELGTAQPQQFIHFDMVQALKEIAGVDFQLDCSPACKPDQSYQVRLEAAMSTTALPNFIIKIIIIIIISFSTV